MLALNDKVDSIAIVKLLKSEGINNTDELQDNSELKEVINGCDSCINNELYVLDLSNRFAYNQDIEEFYEVDEEDEDCIEDFVLYFCSECGLKQYYIQL